MSLVGKALWLIETNLAQPATLNGFADQLAVTPYHLARAFAEATGHPVMPIGGFNGTDPAPAPDEFLRLALAKRIHYFIVTNPIHEDKWGHLDTNGLIQQWVQRNYTPQLIGRVEVYDLTK